MKNASTIEVAGAYEAAAHTAESHEDGHHDCKNWLRETFCGDVIAKAIRSLDSSAARRGKQRIREAAIEEVAGLLERSPKHKWPHMTQEDWVTSVRELKLIDKPGGR